VAEARRSARLQLVVPCYNEAGRLPAAAFLEAARQRNDTEFLFVNDGSTDDTAGMLARLCASADGNGHLASLNLARNGGKAAAVRSGVLAALERNPEFVGYWDADLATPLAAVQDFVNVLDSDPQIDIVMGARVKLLGHHVERYRFRHYSGRMFATAASMALRLGVYDTQCGAKIFRVTPGTRAAFAAPFRSRWVFDVELLARYIEFHGRAAASSSIYELPLTTWVDVPGSKVKAWHGVQAMWDIARIWRRTPRS
jgi:glycosyltransferase involved in cell wall biosynthesis